MKIDLRAFSGTAQVLLLGVDVLTGRSMGWNVNGDREMSVLVEKGLRNEGNSETNSGKPE